MSREIKFRAYDKHAKIMLPVVDVIKFTKSESINIMRDGAYGVGVTIPYQPQIELMQFTGLHDKNGKEIYEGDIVEIDKDVAKTFDIYSKGIINYLNGGFIVTKNDGSYATIKSALLILGDLNNIFRGKVIGNIYENPELLKGADNIE